MGGGGGGLIGQLSRHNDGSKQVVQARTAKSGQWREKTCFWITFVARGGRSNCTHFWIYSGFSSRNHLQTMQRTERQFITKVTVIIVFQ